MSTKKLEKSARPIRVLIRGYKDRPAALTAVDFRDKAVDVVGVDPGISIPFHRERVFAFNKPLYRKLTSAFAAHDTAALAMLWSRAQPIRA